MKISGNKPTAKTLISRLALTLIWLALPVTLLAGASAKTSVSIIILAGSVLFFHTCMAIINRDMIHAENKWPGLLLIILFGSVEIDHLKRKALQANPQAQKESATPTC